jgi:hypothetical protein
VGQALGVATSAPATPILGLVALMIAFLLVMTRRSMRTRKKDAAGLIPEITPAPIPSLGPDGTSPAAERSVSPAEQPAGVVTSAPAMPGPELIALVAASLLVIARLFMRRQANRRGPGA